MKGLLHSKIFKKNLAKWFVMYLGVISLLTTIITYSKYMSELQTMSDSARVAKFNIKVIPNNSCDLENNNCLGIEKVRPTSTLSYDFTIDLTELEVSTDLILTLYINKDFEFISLEKLEGNQYQEISDFKLTNDQRETLYNYGSLTSQFISVTHKPILKYRVKVKYKYSSKEIFSNNKNIVKIGYSAIQNKGVN